jgi:hypothetical protein
LIRRSYPQNRVDDLFIEISFDAYGRACKYFTLVDLIQCATEAHNAQRRGEEVPELLEFFISKLYVEIEPAAALH